MCQGFWLREVESVVFWKFLRLWGIQILTKCAQACILEGSVKEIPQVHGLCVWVGGGRDWVRGGGYLGVELL